MTQEIIVGLLFIAAVVFIGRKVLRSTFSHKAEPGCEKCEVEKK